MAFDKSRVYTALNADELKIGSKVCVADSISCLEDCVTENCNPVTLREVRGAEHKDRFVVLCDDKIAFNLAYLIEPPEEKKLKWTDLEVGDLITNGDFFCMVTGIDKGYATDKHIYVGYGWLSNENLKDWEKVERYHNEEWKKVDKEEQGERMKEIAKEYIDFSKVKRTERGWAGHFCCAEMCRFRRNTLLEYNGNAIVVSTVGAMYNSKGDLEEIGLGRHYETMAFRADDSEYKDSNVSEEIIFDSPWQLKWHKEGYIDNEVNAMHEKVVEELTEKLLKGEL